MLTEDKHNGKIYTLMGEAITQAELAALINTIYGTELAYEPMSVEAYTEERVAELGKFMGTVISGIYAGIRKGAYAGPSDFTVATGREHLSPEAMIREVRNR